MVDTVYIDAPENALLMLALSNGIDLGVALWSGVKSQLIVVDGNMTAVRFRDEILRPVNALVNSFQRRIKAATAA